MTNSAPAVLRYAVRALARTPGASALAIATIAIAIGATTAIFSIVYATILRPLPYPDPGRLVAISSEFPNIRLKEMGLSGPEFVELQRLTSCFANAGAVRFDTATLGGVEPRRVNVALASSWLIQALGVNPLLGRTLNPENDRARDGKVVVLGHGLWLRAYGADPDLVGRQIDVDGESRTVLGVMPAGFDLLGNDTDLWLPLGLNPSAPGSRADHALRVIARLSPDISMTQARNDLNAAVARWTVATGELHSPAPRFHPLAMTSLQEVTTGQLRQTMLILMGAVGLVLLLACVNVANLLIARAEGVRHQLAIRVALGASRARLLLDHLAEGLCLAASGCAAGLVLAYLISSAFARSTLLRSTHEIDMDVVVLAFGVGVSALSGLVFGLAPVLRRDIGHAQAWLHSDARGISGSREWRRLQHAMIAIQVGLALTLLAGAGVLLQSFWRLARVDPGIRTDDVVTFQLSIPERRFAADAQVWELYERLLARLESLDGVRRAAAMSGRLPQRRANNTTFVIEGVAVQGHEGMPQVEFIQHVTPGYFATVGIQLLKGRLLSSLDTETSQAVAVVNETLARKFWGIANPLGQRLRPALPDSPWFTVVGVVSDVKHAGLAAPVGTELYVAHRQSRLLLPAWLPESMHVVLRAAGDRREAIIRAVPAVIHDVDPHVAIANLQPMSQAVSDSIARPAFVAALLSSFAALALLIATVGIYGVISYGVAQRTSEFGVRMALGASRRDVLALVLVQAAVPIAVGILLGLGGAVGSARLLAAHLFKVRPASPPVLLVVVFVLVSVALVACWIPARRATRVDPLEALRTL